MPNHWRTRLTFKKTLSPEMRETLEKQCLCELVMPMPKLLRNTAYGGRTFDGERVTSWYSNRDTQEERPFTQEEKTQLAKLGSTSWYDWAIRNWGTKWGTYNQGWESPRCLVFDSAWAPPNDAVFQALANRVGIAFTVYGHDEGESHFDEIGTFVPEEEA